MSKWHLIQSLQREMYKKLTLIVFNVFRRILSLGAPGLSPRFSSGAKIFGQVSHSTELVRMDLACQHFDFNSADWISDNLHVISSWYLRTMGKEFIFRFSRRLWGGNAWRTPKNVRVGASNDTQRIKTSVSFGTTINVLLSDLAAWERWKKAH